MALSAAQLGSVRLIAGAYDDNEGWISDDDIQRLADFLGNEDIQPLAVEILRIVLARGVGSTRAAAMRQRIVELSQVA